MNAIQNIDCYPFLNACKRLQMLKNVFVTDLMEVNVLNDKGEI